jgi:hypothetical protein
MVPKGQIYLAKQIAYQKMSVHSIDEFSMEIYPPPPPVNVRGGKEPLQERSLVCSSPLCYKQTKQRMRGMLWGTVAGFHFASRRHKRDRMDGNGPPASPPGRPLGGVGEAALLHRVPGGRRIAAPRPERDDRPPGGLNPCGTDGPDAHPLLTYGGNVL